MLKIAFWQFGTTNTNAFKSDYRLLSEAAEKDNASTSNPEFKKKFWSGIWKLKIPGKVKHYLWKAYSNTLPTKQNLQKRKILNDSTFHLYSKENESSMHALWDCEKIQEVWSHIFRNKTRITEVSTPLDRIAKAASDFLQWIRCSNYPGMKTKPTAKLERWIPPHPRPPPSDSLKTNFDGAIFQEPDEAGTGVVIRNFTGEVMVALSEKITKPSSVSILESIVPRRAVQFVRELDFDHSYFEGDLRFLFRLYEIVTCFPLLLVTLFKTFRLLLALLKLFPLSYC
uniref:Reverse transcriptase zinc-binding domain-containing protein n=1 Tax=Quercus lobata TaxID=97700 RepID=A0A7N2LZ18_QUELO